MQIFGQMARVPVTARQKFEEAAYFYNGMVAHRLNVIVFPYYLQERDLLHAEAVRP
jgi:hypothetical protein